MTTEQAAAPPTTPSVPLAKLARVYRKMQSKKQALTKEYEAALAEIETQQAVVRIALKDQMLAMQSSSVRTDEGTVVLSTKTRYNASDWDALSQFVYDHKALDLLEKRIAQTNMGAFLAANPKLVPPGLTTFSEYVVSVRKPPTP